MGCVPTWEIVHLMTSTMVCVCVSLPGVTDTIRKDTMHSTFGLIATLTNHRKLKWLRTPRRYYLVVLWVRSLMWVCWAEIKVCWQGSVPCWGLQGKICSLPFPVLEVPHTPWSTARFLLLQSPQHRTLPDCSAVLSPAGHGQGKFSVFKDSF